MQSKEKDNLVFLRLFPGEDIYPCLKQACQKHKVQTAVVLCGLGQLGQLELGFFKEKGDYLPQKFSTAYELLSLSGLVSKEKEDYKFHLHAVLANAQKQALGGHLIAGKVSITGEFVLLKTDLTIKRQREPEFGLDGLFLEN